MKQKLPLYALVASALLLTGCIDFDFCDSCGDGDKDIIPMSTVVAFNPNDYASSATLNLNIDAPWALLNTDMLPGWLTVSPHIGEGGPTVTISIEGANTTDKPLVHFLTFLSLSGEKQIIKVVHEELDIAWYNDCDKIFSIGTRHELAGLAYLVNRGIDNFRGKTITLKKSIDLSPWDKGKGWIPIGRSNRQPFVGLFNGDAHVISNIVINCDDFSYTGLFGYVNGGTIKNTVLTNVKIVGGDNTGGIAGYAWRSNLIDCNVTGEVKGRNMVGGIAGVATGNVINSHATCAVMGAAFTGGLVGWAGGNITDCSVTGMVNGATYVGGLAGSITEGIATYCSTSGTVKGNDVVGGIAGTIHNSTVANCNALNVSVIGLTNVGSVVGTCTGVSVLENNTP